MPVILMALSAMACPPSGKSATMADELAALRETCRQWPVASAAQSNLVERWMAQKQGLIRHLQPRPEAIAEVSNQLCLTTSAGVSPADALYLNGLIDVLGKADAPTFLEAAYAAVAAPGIHSSKFKLLSTVYTMASITRSNDVAIREKARRNLKAAALMDDQRLRLAAMKFLTEGIEMNGVQVGRGGLDPELGLKLLREVVEDDGRSFREKEEFAFVLAKRDRNFADYYHQNVKTLYLTSFRSTSAEGRLLYAEKLHQLGRVTDKELEEYKRAAEDEKTARQKSGGRIGSFELKPALQGDKPAKAE